MSPISDRKFSLASFKALLGDRASVHRYGIIVAAFFVCFAAFVGFGAVSGSSATSGLEVGKVADRDVVAEENVVYVDVKATEIRVEAERRLVPAVFSLDDGITKTAMESIVAFRKGFLELASSTNADGELALRVRGRFPDTVSEDLVARLVDYPAPGNAIDQGRVILQTVMGGGVFAFPSTGLEHYNPETVELRRWTDGPLVYEQVAIDKVTTMRRFRAVALETARSLKLSATMASLAVDTAMAFAGENAFFDREQSQRRLEAAVARVEPVMRRIAKGDRVIRQGFIVTAEDLERLAALRGPGSRLDPLYVFGGALLLVLLIVAAVALLSTANTGVRVEGPGFLFVILLATGFFVLANALAAFLPASLSAHLEALFPTALLSMLVAILIGERYAILFTMALATSLLLVTGFDAFVPAQSLLSGVAGIVLVRKAERRIDLVRAGSQLALARFLCGFALAALADRGVLDAIGTGFWSSVNGFLCGVLALAFLPVLEQALNAPT
ncbi:MAG: hypothetical protein JXM71_11660, partial [Spirochaetales bacterium]|nr:hypothetical protein [Spirochaetales bacterium]